MRSDTFLLNAPDGTPLFVRRWLPDGDARGAVQIAHGMAEHSARYARLAEVLTADGFAVYANDHRGHGETAADPKDVGFFADKGGFDLVVDDLHLLTERIADDLPGIPIVLLGHSMGSFMARVYAARHSADIAGLVLSGTGGSQGLLGTIGQNIARVQATLRGRRHRSGLMNTLSFGQYNNAFKPTRTDFDWLSRDEAEVDAYIADPQCGEVFTAGFYVDLLGGIAASNDPKVLASIRPDLPVLVISGDADPVGDAGKGVRAVADALSAARVEDVTCTLYPGARHELFNETNRDEVMADLLGWLDQHIPGDAH